jgi:hypothetical protein
MTNYYKFNLGDKVRIKLSGEVGIVMYRAESMYTEARYGIDYVDMQGCFRSLNCTEFDIELDI